MSFEVANLHFSFPRTAVLNGVTIPKLESGALHVLLGPNAAGKSTLFRCLSGLLSIQKGTIRLNDQDVVDWKGSHRHREVCYMPQTFSHSAALTVFELVLLARKQLETWRVSADDVAAVRDALEECGVEHLSERYIGELSGGQQQLVSLCQAVVRPCSLLLLDEPTSALDLRRQLQVMELIKAITRSRDIVTIVALHDLNLAARFADTLLVLKDGSLVEYGETEEVLKSEMLANVYGLALSTVRADDGSLAVVPTLKRSNPE